VNVPDDEWIVLAPREEQSEALQTRFVRRARVLGREIESLEGDSRLNRVKALRNDALEYGELTRKTLPDTELRTALSVLFDLLEQGWLLRTNGKQIAVRRPVYVDDEHGSTKEKIRRTLLVGRDEGLREKSVRRFVEDLETRRPGPNGEWVSVFSLMRDGSDLASRLKKVQAIGDPELRFAALRTVLRPYLQIVDEEGICRHTGLRLLDVWRYFRLTWSTVHKTTPGRRMLVLVRDAAAPYHPVIGIACIASPIVQLTCRDRWIGWETGRFVEELHGKKAPQTARRLLEALCEAIRGIYTTDLLSEGLLTKGDLRRPSAGLRRRLRAFAQSEIVRHQLHPTDDDLKHLQSGGTCTREHCRRAAESALYRSKRAKALASLLDAKRVLTECRFGESRELGQLAEIIKRPDVRTAVGTVLREIKAKNLGIGVLELSVCGAIAPYNALLGGKLVSLLMASPELARGYQARYARLPSVIASAMKGAPVFRPPRPVLLETTSLYASHASQYNRIRMPANSAGGPAGRTLEFIELGETLGFGSFHIRRVTVRLMEKLMGRSNNGRKVNSIFGEGVNPLLRKIRDGLLAVGFPDTVLNHGSPRLVYVVPLGENFREMLLGSARRLRAYLPASNPRRRTEQLAEFWRRRWLDGRTGREGILDAVAQHTLDVPIRHGARVPTVETLGVDHVGSY